MKRRSFFGLIFAGIFAPKSLKKSTTPISKVEPICGFTYTAITDLAPGERGWVEVTCHGDNHREYVAGLKKDG